MGRNVVRAFFGSILALVLILASGSSAQKRVTHYPQPPAPSMPGEIDTTPKPQSPQARMNIIEMERESKELSHLAGSIPGDVELLKKGLLPKDVVDKLKRIEKLSKHLRSEIVF
jgi:hypothetical protein